MKVLFLDRDGVINNGDENGFVNKQSDFWFIRDSLKAIQTLTSDGWRIFVVTNQGGIANGHLTKETLTDIHNFMLEHIEKEGGKIEKIYYCPHSTKGNCKCRKPKPGMILKAAEEFELDLSNAFLIGDYISDFQAATAVNVQPIRVMSGRGQTDKVSEYVKERKNEIPTFFDLYHAANFLHFYSNFNNISENKKPHNYNTPYYKKVINNLNTL